MLFHELIDRANEETKIILNKYMLLFHKYSLRNSDPIHEKFLKSFNNNRAQLAIGYLLYIAITYNEDLANILNKYGNLEIPFSTEIEEIIKNLNREYTLNTYDIICHEEYAADSVLKAYANLSGPVCIERIIHNIFKDFINIFPVQYFNINYESLKEIEALANAKEKNIPYQCSNSSINNSKVAVNIPKNPINTPFGENLTCKTYLNNPLIGRNKEFRDMCALLMDEEKSLIIHGLPGIGKTTLIKGLAYNIQNGLAPKALQDKQIIEVSASELISGCKYVGMVEERVLDFINSLLNQNVILFIDEIHTLMGLGKGDGDNNDVSNILKPYLGDGRIKIVGATTTEEYSKILENGAFARRFNGLEISVLSDKDVLIILKALIARYQETKRLGFSYSEDIQNSLLKLILLFTNKKHQNCFYDKQLFNPDFALTILRNGYNYAQVDSKDALDVEALIEGFKAIDFISDTHKEEFEEKALSLVRKPQSDKNVIDIRGLLPNHSC